MVELLNRCTIQLHFYQAEKGQSSLETRIYRRFSLNSNSPLKANEVCFLSMSSHKVAREFRVSTTPSPSEIFPLP